MHIHRDTVISQDNGQCQHCGRKVVRVLVGGSDGPRVVVGGLGRAREDVARARASQRARAEGRMKQRYGKPDANHSEVKRWYFDLGCAVADTKDAGLGVPDLFVGCAGITDPVEVKTEDGDLLPTQKTFILAWRGSPVAIVRTQDDVIAHVHSMRKRARRAA